MLALKDALDTLDTGAFVSLCFVKHSKSRGAAGDIVRIKRCRLAAAQNAAATTAGATSTPLSTGKPAHLRTSDIRLVRTTNKELREFHPRLLFAFNGRAIV